MLRILKTDFCLNNGFLNVANEIICLRVSTGFSFPYNIIRESRMLAIIRLEWGVFDTVLI